MNRPSENLDFLFKIVESLPDGIIVIDNTGKVILVNKILLDCINLSGDTSQYIDKHITEVIENELISQEISNSLEQEEFQFLIQQIRIKKKYYEVIAKPVLNGMIIIIRDISQAVKIKNINLKNIFKGQEIEKKRLSKEIHDGIGPVLSSIKLGIDNVKSKSKDQPLVDELSNISSQISEVAQDIRQISHTLMPASLSDFGLVTAIENLVSRIKNASTVNVITDFQISDDDELFSKEEELNLYRIVQEAINNSIKHGQAKNININLLRKATHILLQIIDDGTGKDSRGNSKDGIGLKNMRSRVASMTGKFESKSKRPTGFQINIKLPLQQQS